VAELGRGVLERLAHVVFQDFAAEVRAAVEADAVAGAPAAGSPGGRPRAAMRPVPLVFRALGAWMAGWWRPRTR
jgi:hypothetical protein